MEPTPTRETIETEEDIQGIDSSVYAYSKCEFCHGIGYVAVEDGGRFPRQDICGCVLENRRRHAVEVRLKHTFGAGALAMTFAAYKPGQSPKNQAAYEGCWAYVQHFPTFAANGVGFALQGTWGCGKTHLATATLIGLVKMWPGRDGGVLKSFSISTPELFRLARKRMDDRAVEDVIERAMQADICLLDDIGAEYHRDGGEGMSWVDEQLYVILDYRLDNNLPTIYTTNLRRSELGRLLDPRIVRRLDTKTATIWPVEKVEDTGRPDQSLRDLLSPPARSTPKRGGGS